MTIGITGLGLIGGSAAKAYREYSIDSLTEIKIYGYDINDDVLNTAISENVLDGLLDEESICLCDMILVALYPEKAIEYIRSISPYIKPHTLVMDLCGTKGHIVSECSKIAKEYNYQYLGGHPMAGTHHQGYKFARSTMFHGSPMVIVPNDINSDNSESIEKAKKLLSPLGFRSYSITSADEHDRLIAFTSQLAHVVSNAYVKSPTAREHKGFSAGSYKDLTRVAWLNENMWTELFFENKEPLIFEIDRIIDSLKEYSDALKDNDKEKMRDLLRDGRIAKEEIDNK